MPIPVTPITPANHPQSIDNQLAALGPIIAGGAGLIRVAYDEVVATYNADGTLNVATYKLATVTVATLTCSYTAGLLTGAVVT
jgi:hypothetical protein